MKAAERTCCDGLCHFGWPCPQVDNAAPAAPACRRVIPLKLAPGVVDGPHRGLSLRQRIAKATAAALLRSGDRR